MRGDAFVVEQHSGDVFAVVHFVRERHVRERAQCWEQIQRRHHLRRARGGRDLPGPSAKQFVLGVSAWRVGSGASKCCCGALYAPVGECGLANAALPRATFAGVPIAGVSAHQEPRGTAGLVLDHPRPVVAGEEDQRVVTQVVLFQGGDLVVARVAP